MAQKDSGSGISIQTLAISAAAAVAAAVIVPMIWERGTLFATAMTPVIVALVSEGLRKPAEKITAVTPLVTRRSATGAAVRDPDFEPLPPGEQDVAVSEDDPFGLRSRPPGASPLEAGAGHRGRRLRGRRGLPDHLRARARRAGDEGRRGDDADRRLG